MSIWSEVHHVIWISTQLLSCCLSEVLHLQFSQCHSVLLLFFKQEGFFIFPNLSAIWNIIETSEAISVETQFPSKCPQKRSALRHPLNRFKTNKKIIYCLKISLSSSWQYIYIFFFSPFDLKAWLKCLKHICVHETHFVCFFTQLWINKSYMSSINLIFIFSTCVIVCV